MGAVFGLQPLRTKQLLIEDLARHAGVALEVQSRAVLPRDDRVGGFMVWGLPPLPLSSSSTSGHVSSLLVFPEVPTSQGTNSLRTWTITVSLITIFVYWTTSEWNYNGGRHYLIQESCRLADDAVLLVSDMSEYELAFCSLIADCCVYHKIPLWIVYARDLALKEADSKVPPSLLVVLVVGNRAQYSHTTNSPATGQRRSTDEHARQEAAPPTPSRHVGRCRRRERSSVPQSVVRQAQHHPIDGFIISEGTDKVCADHPARRRAAPATEPVLMGRPVFLGVEQRRDSRSQVIVAVLRFHFAIFRVENLPRREQAGPALPSAGIVLG